MQILELQMKNFGKFTNQKLTFHRGINVFYGENETGKSTVHAFIRAMLFGIEKQRGRAAKTDEYALRQPWNQPASFSGVMRFESGGKIFRLEREFDRQRKSAILICETDGEELSVEDGDLDVLLEGLNETSFCNTYFISQKGSATQEQLAGEVRNYMNNLQHAGDSAIDIGAAKAVLQNRKRKTEADRKRQQARQQEVRKEICMKMDYVREELEKGKREEEPCLSGEQECRQQLERLQRTYEAARRRKEETQREQKEPGIKWIPAILLVLSVILILVVPKFWMKLPLLLLSAVLALWMLKSWKAEYEEEPFMEAEEEQLKEYREQIRRIEQELGKIQWQRERIRTGLHEKQTLYENLKEELEEQEQEVKAVQEEEVRALVLAMETLEQASAEVHRRWGNRLNSRVSEILSEITEGRYTSIVLDEEFHIRINTPEKLLGIWQVSGGTVEQIYFALRMAAGELLTAGEEMPVILDEAFAMYDDTRLTQTLRWLERSGKQVLLFTCHTREAELLEKIQNDKIK